MNTDIAISVVIFRNSDTSDYKASSSDPEHREALSQSLLICMANFTQHLFTTGAEENLRIRTDCSLQATSEVYPLPEK